MVTVGFPDCEYSLVAALLLPVHDGAFCVSFCISSAQHTVNEPGELLSTSWPQLQRLKCCTQSSCLLCSAGYFNMSFLLQWMLFIINIHLHKHSSGRLAMLHLLINLRLFINRWKMFSCKNGSVEQCASSEFYIAKICWAGVELNYSVLQISLTFLLYIKVKHIISKMQC